MILWIQGSCWPDEAFRLFGLDGPYHPDTWENANTPDVKLYVGPNLLGEIQAKWPKLLEEVDEGHLEVEIKGWGAYPKRWDLPFATREEFAKVIQSHIGEQYAARLWGRDGELDNLLKPVTSRRQTWSLVDGTPIDQVQVILPEPQASVFLMRLWSMGVEPWSTPWKGKTIFNFWHVREANMSEIPTCPPSMGQVELLDEDEDEVEDEDEE